MELNQMNFNLSNRAEAEKKQNGIQKLLNTFTGEESQQDLNFSTDDNDVHFKKEQKKRNTIYSSTRVKARNLLTNVGYRRFKDSDFKNLNFISDLLSFLLQNFNPINIDRKVDTEDEQLMIRFIWEKCVPFELASEIYKTPNYQILADPRLTFHKANQIIINWLRDFNKKDELQKTIAANFKSIHYIYSSLYPKIYCKTNQFGIRNKSEFDLAFTIFKVEKQSNNRLKQTDIKNFFSIAKNAEVYEERKEFHPNEQKPIKIDEIDSSKEEIEVVEDKWQKAKLPTVRKRISTEEYKKQKYELKRQLDENTKYLESLKKLKKKNNLCCK